MRRIGSLIAAIVLAAPGGALGADSPFRRGIDPVVTKPAATLDGFLTSEGARTEQASSWGVELALDFNSSLMSLKFGDQKLDSLIKERVDLHLLASYAVTDWAELGVDVPVTVFQSNGFAAMAAVTGFSDTPPQSAGMGDIRVLGKFRLLPEEKYYVTVAAIAELRIPTGADSSFLGERSVLVYPRAMVERTFLKRLRVGVDLGYRYRALPGRYLNLYVGDELAFSVEGSLDLPRLFDRTWSVSAEINFSTPARAPFNNVSDSLKTPFEWLVGIRSQVYKNFYVQLGGGSGYLGESGFGREGVRLFAMFGWAHVWKDRDHDGIPDDEDRCPDVPGVAANHGCPAVAAPPPVGKPGDRDGDGIPDAEDACPDQPGPAKWKGCPDTDGDGVPDNLDRCPKDPGPMEYDGCPDRDGDEVPDIDDKCPDQPGPATNDGCPLQKPYVELDKGGLTLKDSVHFDSGKATIKNNSLPILDELASVLRAHPEVKHVRIDGHTDNVGGAALNQDLSQRRSQSVVEYLVAKGIERTRLGARGFGLDKPIATNATALGRAKNRRVECTVLEQ